MSAHPRTIAVRDEHIPDPTIACPHCQHEIKLTESLAAPLLKNKEAEFKRLEAQLREREAAVNRERESLDAQVAERVALERKKVAEDEQRKARLALGAELETRQREVSELNDLLKRRDEKLAEAQRTQAEVIRKQRELQEKERELELTVEKRINESVAAIQAKAKQDAEDQLKLKLADKDQLIGSMQKQIEDLRRKAEQGSQQLQGDVQEQELESLLTGRFVHDTIMRVQKGEFGGDVVQLVVTPSGNACGSILWESKRTRNWSDGWLAKLREDQRNAKADFAVIVSQTLPKDVKNFDLIEGVYVVSPQCALPVATLLRKALVELAIARQSSEGRETKAAMVYEYLTGPRFRQRLQAMVEAFTSMQDDLNAEKKAIQKQWAKRETQIERMIGATTGMFGDLQGIAGKSIEEIEGLGLVALEGPG